MSHAELLRPDLRRRNKAESRAEDMRRLRSGQVSADQLYRENALVSAFADLSVKVVKRGKLVKAR